MEFLKILAQTLDLRQLSHTQLFIVIVFALVVILIMATKPVLRQKISHAQEMEKLHLIIDELKAGHAVPSAGISIKTSGDVGNHATLNSLLTHSIFHQETLEVAIYSMELTDNARKLIFRDTFNIFLKHFRKKLKLYLLESFRAQATGFGIGEDFEKLMDLSFIETVAEWEEVGIPAPVVGRYRKDLARFLMIQNESIDRVCGQLKSSTEAQRCIIVLVIFEVLKGALSTMLTDGSEKINGLNGKLTGIKYKGEVCS